MDRKLHGSHAVSADPAWFSISPLSQVSIRFGACFWFPSNCACILILDLNYKRFARPAEAGPQTRAQRSRGNEALESCFSSPDEAAGGEEQAKLSPGVRKHNRDLAFGS